MKTKKYILLTFLISVFCLPGMAQPADQVPVFARFENGYDTFRIPSLVQSKKGTLLAFCQGRTNSRADFGNNDIVLRRSEDGGKTWGDLILVWDFGEENCGAPCPIVERETGRIIVLTEWHRMKEGGITDENCEQYRTRLYELHSDDDGLTWSEPRDITASTIRPEWHTSKFCPGNAIQLESGRIVAPCTHSFRKDGKRVTASHLAYSDDRGETWQIGADAECGNECVVAELDNGDLLLNMRTYGAERTEEGYRMAAISHDQGETLETPYYDHYLIEEQCHASMINYRPAGQKTGRILFCNPESLWWRNNMNIRMSTDNGQTWERVAWVNKGPAGYSSICALNDGRVGVLYETGVRHYNETISFGSIPAESMFPEPDEEVLLYPEGQNVDQGIVENGQQITLGPGESSGLDLPELINAEGHHDHVGDHARLYIYVPEHCNGQMVVVTPGGEYSVVCHRPEGHNVAKWLGRRGIATCVVVYRAPNGHPQIPLTDVQNAFRYCRHHAEEWGVQQIGVMGFSAGGHLAAMASNWYVDEVTKPDFSVLVYPVIDMDHHLDTYRNLTGDRKRLKKKYSMQYAVNEHTPATFLAHSQNDDGVSVQSSLAYFNALTEHGVKAEMCIFPEGGHGYGFAEEDILTDGRVNRLGNYMDGFLHNLEIFLNEVRPKEE